MSNRHPIDELADVREEKKILSAREDELKEQILLLGEGERTGDEHFASVTTSTAHRLDRPALELRFGKEAVEACCKESSTTTIRLIKRQIHGDVF